MYFFNNCRGREHSRMYGRGAFYDLGTTGFQATKATDFGVGDKCIVATRRQGNDRKIEFTRFVCKRVETIKQTMNPQDEDYKMLNRVFFRTVVKRETLSKGKAARHKDYSAFFDRNGNFKRQSAIRV
jgi:hypothetical protein